MGFIEKIVNEVSLDDVKAANEPKPLSSTGMSKHLYGSLVVSRDFTSRLGLHEGNSCRPGQKTRRGGKVEIYHAPG